MDMEAQFDRNERRREASNNRAWDKLGKQVDEAEALVGQFVHGEFYINVRSKPGHLTGAIRRFARRSDAVHFLIRNRYV